MPLTRRRYGGMEPIQGNLGGPIAQKELLAIRNMNLTNGSRDYRPAPNLSLGLRFVLEIHNYAHPR